MPCVFLVEICLHSQINCNQETILVCIFQSKMFVEKLYKLILPKLYRHSLKFLNIPSYCTTFLKIKKVIVFILVLHKMAIYVCMPSSLYKSNIILSEALISTNKYVNYFRYYTTTQISKNFFYSHLMLVGAVICQQNTSR